MHKPHKISFGVNIIFRKALIVVVAENGVRAWDVIKKIVFDEDFWGIYIRKTQKKETETVSHTNNVDCSKAIAVHDVIILTHTT